MLVADFQNIVTVLNEAKVRFLIVGGLAVVAHGYVRNTIDVDLVIDLVSQNNVLRALDALGRLGYKPLIPELPGRFADPRVREEWIRDKGMVVFQMRSETRRETPIDIFVRLPFDFDAEYHSAVEYDVGSGLICRVVRCSTLIDMKRQAGRAKDLADIESLEHVNRLRSNDG